MEIKVAQEQWNVIVWDQLAIGEPFLFRRASGELYDDALRVKINEFSYVSSETKMIHQYTSNEREKIVRVARVELTPETI